MTTWQEAEEADQEAAERARVHQWALDHPNPLAAALRRAEAAEARVLVLEEQQAGRVIDISTNGSWGPATTRALQSHLRRDGGEPT